MAATLKMGSRLLNRLKLKEIVRNLASTPRRFLKTVSSSTTDMPQQQQQQQQQQETTETKKETWLSNFFVRRIDPGHESHSSRLSDKDIIYELQVHAVKPEFMSSYLGNMKTFINMMDTKKTGAELVGGWTVDIGDQDEAIHIWRYPGGYKQLNNVRLTYRTDQDFLDFRKNRNVMLRSRKNQIILEFSYWGGIKPRPGNNIYELRSYVLKPGTMIEWGNYWAKGIKHRQDNGEATAGFFSHIGDLYVAHHLWAYENLEVRQEVRDHAWERPGWDVCVQHTVPLIRHMTSRILVPTPYSPLK